MKPFDRNLATYHAENRLMDLTVEQFNRKMRNAKTSDERNQIQHEEDEYFKQQEKKYHDLGQEMVEIMSKKWWEFWK